MLRPTFLSFETAKMALNTSQIGLDTVGHNISNVNTPGFTRQRVDQVSISSSGYKSQFQAFGVQFPGQGSSVTGITQIRDPFLDKRYRDEASQAGELSTKSEGLANINAIFDEILSSSGSHTKMGGLLSALDGMIREASNTELVTVLRNKATEVAQVLSANYKSLENVTEQTIGELKYSVEDMNSMLEQIAMLNVKIKEDNFYGNPANELNDQRNLLIDQLSELVDIDVKRTPVKISGDVTIQELSIEIKGSGSGDSETIVLVKSGEYNGFAVNTDEDGTATISLVDGKNGMPIYDKSTGTDDVTDRLYTGALKGHLDILNGEGIYAETGESGFRGIPYYKQALDDYAVKFATAMNDLNAVKVVDGTGAVVGTIQMPLFASSDGEPLSAKNIAVSKQWAASPSFINKTAASGYLQINANEELMLPGDPPTTSGIKLADVKGVDSEGYLLDINGEKLPGTGGVFIKNVDLYRDNSTAIPGADATDNLSAMKLALTSPTRFSNGTTGSFQEYLVAFSAEMGLDQSLNDAMLDSTLNVMGGIADARDGVSAVNIDEEGINMMTYQNYYNAAARYMTVLDEALGTIIQSMGVVGR